MVGLNFLIEELIEKVNCLIRSVTQIPNVFGLTLLSPPVDAPTGNNKTVLFNPITGVNYYWNGSAWISYNDLFAPILANGAAIKTIEITLSSTDILGMFVTPVLAIPGEVGKVHSILKVVSYVNFGGIAYAGGGALSLRDVSLAIPQLTTNISNTPLITAAISTVAGIQVPSNTTGITTTVGGDIFVSNASAAFTTGNGTMKLTITYQTITV